MVALVGTDDVRGLQAVSGVSGAGLTWKLGVRANIQAGTSEIWYAFAPQALTGVSVTANISLRAPGQITVMSFSGVDTTNGGAGGDRNVITLERSQRCSHSIGPSNASQVANHRRSERSSLWRSLEYPQAARR